MQRLLVLVMVCAALSACGSWRAAKVYPGMHVANEVIMRAALEDITAGKTAGVKVVLRVPEPPTYLTQESQRAVSQGYDWFERELARAGYIVRDRTLLEKVLGGDRAASYAGIAQAIDTDLIIEILYMGPCDLSHNSYYDVEDGVVRELIVPAQKDKAPVRFAMRGGRLDCRVITVKDATVSGMFTLYTVPNEGICDFEVQPDKACRAADPKNPRAVGYTAGTDEKIVRSLAEQLVQTLQKGEVALKVIQHGGLAEKFRLRPNDIFVKINDQAVHTVPQAIDSLMRVDGTCSLLLRRDGQEVPVTISKRYAEPLGIRLAYRQAQQPVPAVAALPVEVKPAVTDTVSVSTAAAQVVAAQPVSAPEQNLKKAASSPTTPKKPAPKPKPTVKKAAPAPKTIFVATYKPPQK